MIALKYYTKFRLITFLFFLILFALVEITMTMFTIDSFYIGIVVIFVFVLFFQKSYVRVLDTMARKVLLKFETSCLIEDISDYHQFLEKRYKRIYTKNMRFKTLYFYYLTSFYTNNKEFHLTNDLLVFLSSNPRFNVSKIQVLNTEMLIKAIDGDFTKVEELYNELCKCVDIEMSKYKEESNQIVVLENIKYSLGKFVELTKDVNEETISNARKWINKNVNLYNAIDNYVIIKIIKHNNKTEFIEEFQENLDKIDGDIVFLKNEE